MKASSESGLCAMLIVRVFVEADVGMAGFKIAD
jgi:hypothetical protein